VKQLVLFAFVLAVPCLVAIAEGRNTATELVAIEQSLSDALLRADWKTVERLYADDLVFTNGDGSVTHKIDDVGSIRSGDVKFESIEMSDARVQDFGDVGVVTLKLVEKVRYKTADLSGTYRLTDVWAKRNGKWQLVAGQETLCAPPK
jgi:ketosteroid isomerase-like protein